MNQNYTDFKFPQIKPCPWDKVFQSCPNNDASAIEFVAALLQYEPNLRLSPIHACLHPFFDELRDPNFTKVDDDTPLPPLFNFTPEEYSIDPSINERLVPKHRRDASNWPPKPVASKGSSRQR